MPGREPDPGSLPADPWTGWAELPASITAVLGGPLALQDGHDLWHALAQGWIRHHPDLGPETEARLRRALHDTPWPGTRRPLAWARERVTRLLSGLEASPFALRLGVAGAVRRMVPVVHHLDLLTTAVDVGGLCADVEALHGVARVEERESREGEIECHLRLQDGTPVTVGVHPEDGAAHVDRLLRRTGPPAFLRRLDPYAKAQGLRWRGSDARGAVADLGPQVDVEATLLDGLLLPWIPPERRHRAPAPAAVADLVTMRDVRGLCHIHTTAGSGLQDVHALADRATALGYGWMLVADRAPGAFPRGLCASSFEALRDAVDAWHAQPVPEEAPAPIPVFLGVEARVDGAGRPDLPDALLDGSEGVIAVLEDGTPGTTPPDPDVAATDEAARTQRVVAAVAHPKVRILAAPRHGAWHAPSSWHWPTVINALAEHDVALEIPGAGFREALPDAIHRRAQARGVRVLPAADATDPLGFDQAHVAVGALRRGGWRASEVLATLESHAFADWLGGSAP